MIVASTTYLLKKRGIRKPSGLLLLLLLLLAGVATPNAGVPPCWRGREI